MFYLGGFVGMLLFSSGRCGAMFSSEVKSLKCFPGKNLPPDPSLWSRSCMQSIRPPRMTWLFRNNLFDDGLNPFSTLMNALGRLTFDSSLVHFLSCRNTILTSWTLCWLHLVMRSGNSHLHYHVLLYNPSNDFLASDD